MARNGLRATNVNNMIYVFGKYYGFRDYIHYTKQCLPGGDSEILKFDSSEKTWTVFAQINGRPGSKLEVSTVDCTLGKAPHSNKVFHNKSNYTDDSRSQSVYMGQSGNLLRRMDFR